MDLKPLRGLTYDGNLDPKVGCSGSLKASLTNQDQCHSDSMLFLASAFQDTAEGSLEFAPMYQPSSDSKDYRKLDD